MTVHPLNCGSLCPRGRRLINGEGGLLEKGHTVCHCLAIESGDGLVLVDTGFGCPPGLRFFQNLNAADNKARKSNQERLRELAAHQGDEVTLICSHDPHELQREQAKASAATATE